MIANRLFRFFLALAFIDFPQKIIPHKEKERDNISFLPFWGEILALLFFRVEYKASR